MPANTVIGAAPVKLNGALFGHRRLIGEMWRTLNFPCAFFTIPRRSDRRSLCARARAKPLREKLDLLVDPQLRFFHCEKAGDQLLAVGLNQPFLHGNLVVDAGYLLVEI